MPLLSIIISHEFTLNWLVPSKFPNELRKEKCLPDGEAQLIRNASEKSPTVRLCCFLFKEFVGKLWGKLKNPPATIFALSIKPSTSLLTVEELWWLLNVFKPIAVKSSFLFPLCFYSVLSIHQDYISTKRTRAIKSQDSKVPDTP